MHTFITNLFRGGNNCVQVELAEGQVLCAAGEQISTPSVYLVQSGAVSVKQPGVGGVQVKLVEPGGVVSSQLSLVAALTGQVRSLRCLT